MIRRLVPMFLVATILAPLAAAVEISYPELEAYSRKALTLCPGETKIVIEPVDQAGPMNFKAYRVTMTSSEVEACREVAYALVSQKTSDVLMAAVFVLKDDGRTPVEKIKEKAETALKRPYEVSIAGKPNADGLRLVTLTNRTDDGPIVTLGYLDASEKFFMVGRLHDMKKDPRTQYLEMLGAARGAKRGPSMSRVQVLEISDFQCPSCQFAHKQFEPFLKQYGDKIGYTRLDLPFFEHHDWALRAALGARALQRLNPGVYWQYVDFIFANQEQITAENVDSTIWGFMEDHDVALGPVKEFMSSSQEKRELVDQVGRLYSAEIFATPTILVNGQKVYWDRTSTFALDYIGWLLKESSKQSAK